MDKGRKGQGNGVRPVVIETGRDAEMRRRRLGICENECVCNRYRLTHSKQYLAERFEASAEEVDDRPRYNVAPTQQVLTVRKEQGKKVRHFTTMRWGLIPSWAKRHAHWKSDAQRTVGDSHDDTCIPRFYSYETLPHPRRWILRVAENGVGEAALLF
jgi:hypothetical protein